MRSAIQRALGIAALDHPGTEAGIAHLALPVVLTPLRVRGVNDPGLHAGLWRRHAALLKEPAHVVHLTSVFLTRSDHLGRWREPHGVPLLQPCERPIQDAGQLGCELVT